MPSPPRGARTHKPCPTFDQGDRRRVALERQRQRRRDLTGHARRLAGQGSGDGAQKVCGQAQDEREQRGAATGSMDTAEDGAEQQQQQQPRPPSLARLGEGASASRCASRAERSAFYASQLCTPEWVVQPPAPAELAAHFLVSPRPEGRRVLLVASGGETRVRTRSGHQHQPRFASALPGGCFAKAGSLSAEAYSILDCVFHQGTQTYYALDLMCWKGYSLYDCAYEFRRWWLSARLEEIGAMLRAREPSRNKFPIVAVPAWPADAQGLAAARSFVFDADAPHPHGRDGVVLSHREGHYELGPTDLTLLWKDRECSSYLVDTDERGNEPDTQTATLRFRASDAACVTRDTPPAALATMPQSFVDAHQKSLRDGMLLCFEVGAGGLTDLRYTGPAKRRGEPDAMSKLLFQRAVYEGRPIIFEQLCGQPQAS